jgi:hypothetical protein
MNKEMFKKINEIALEAKFSREVKPVTNWKIPYREVAVGNYTLKLLGKITVPEAAIIRQGRKVVDLIEQGYTESLRLLFAEVGKALGFTYLYEVAELFNEPGKWANVLEEKVIEEQQLETWESEVTRIQAQYDVTETRQKFNFFLVTFFLWMRCSEDWTEEETELLSDAEFNRILDLIQKEENPDEVTVVPPPLELKK